MVGVVGVTGHTRSRADFGEIRVYKAQCHTSAFGQVEPLGRVGEVNELACGEGLSIVGLTGYSEGESSKYFDGILIGS